MAKYRHQKFVQAIIFTTTLLKVAGQQKCTMHQYRGLPAANCESLQLKQIPLDLGSNLKMLEISNNPLKHIKRVDMQRYNKLENFSYSGFKHWGETYDVPYTKLEPDAFVDLTDLKILSLSYNNFGSGTKISFPPSITELFLIRSYQNDSSGDYSNLKNLKHIWLGNNLLTRIPQFYKKAPIVTMSFSANPIAFVSAKNLARFCKLNYLYLTVGNMTSFLEDKCECPRLREWLGKREILGPTPPFFECTSGSKCNEELITADMMADYNECMTMYKPKVTPPVNTRMRPRPKSTEAPVKNNTVDVDKDDQPENTKSKKWLKYLLWIFLLAIIVFVTAAILYLIIINRKKFKREKPTTVPPPPPQTTTKVVDEESLAEEFIEEAEEESMEE